jgi:hypothetical protein
LQFTGVFLFCIFPQFRVGFAPSFGGESHSVVVRLKVGIVKSVVISFRQVGFVG